MAWFTRDRTSGHALDDLDRKLRELIAHPMSPNPPETLDPSHLRPRVRSRAAIELARLRYGLKPDGFVDGAEPAVEAIAADLAWELFWDTRSTAQTIDMAQIRRWGTTFPELLDAAKTSLAMDPFLGWRVVKGKIYTPIGENEHDGTRAFLPGALDFLPFTDERVVFRPTRTRCLVTNVSDPEGIAIAADLTLRELDGADRVSCTPVVSCRNGWRPLKLAPSHTAYSRWRKLVTADKVIGYDAQKELLERQLSDDLLVAKYSAIGLNERGTISFTTWSRNAASLLPVADFVSFSDGEAVPIVVPWDAVVELVGHLLEPTSHYPSRFRVVDSPTAGEFEVLRTLATEL